MKKVSSGFLGTDDAMRRKVKELCDASQQCTEEIADAYDVRVPDDFVPVRELDLTGAAPTLDMLGMVVATFLLDMKQRGAGRRTSSV